MCQNKFIGKVFQHFVIGFHEGGIVKMLFENMNKILLFYLFLNSFWTTQCEFKNYSIEIPVDDKCSVTKLLMLETILKYFQVNF